jgi:hypothetical protein
MKAQPLSITIRQIEFEFEKAEHGMAMPHDCAKSLGLPLGAYKSDAQCR